MTSIFLLTNSLQFFSGHPIYLCVQTNPAIQQLFPFSRSIDWGLFRCNADATKISDWLIWVTCKSSIIKTGTLRNYDNSELNAVVVSLWKIQSPALKYRDTNCGFGKKERKLRYTEEEEEEASAFVPRRKTSISNKHESLLLFVKISWKNYTLLKLVQNQGVLYLCQHIKAIDTKIK
ncbi:hypothetical protein WN51_02019 [Melipona quadrifasciata]|uniref:Uncharacterized protein n=1 Tax=Melipona quadrifasciata TaxID=166423 RepID=A0A0N0BKK4_9HYME|nr:hypothetical protein WN51_02019 [Melipona quadrifasciata]